MSKLGFDRVLRQVAASEKEFLRRGMQVAQKEFAKNFRTQMDSGTGTAWEPVLRAFPPPILDVTGELRAQALASGNITFYPRKAVLFVDPIDSNRKSPRGYAKYHQTGTPNMPERRFLTQSNWLTREQKRILLSIQANLFR